MKKLILSAALITTGWSYSALAETISERKASEMVSVLQSEVLKELLTQEDGVGNIQSISARPSMTPASTYEVKFVSYFGLSERTCKVLVSVYGEKISIIDEVCMD